ncbi:MAG: hypothetical protein ABEK59_11805 [Halobacteria archaeon]
MALFETLTASPEALALGAAAVYLYGRRRQARAENMVDMEEVRKGVEENEEMLERIKRVTKNK